MSTESARRIAARLGIDLGHLEPLPSPHGRCFKPRGAPNPSRAELRFGDEVAESRGEDLIFPMVKNEAVIEGFFRDSGKPVQLKNLTGSAEDQPEKVVTRTNKAFDQAVRHGWSGIDLHIEAPASTKEAVLRRWSGDNRQPTPRDMSGGAVAKITVHCSDGPVELPLPGRDIPVPRRGGTARKDAEAQ